MSDRRESGCTGEDDMMKEDGPGLGNAMMMNEEEPAEAKSMSRATIAFTWTNGYHNQEVWSGTGHAMQRWQET
jgi:hypothetical protein